MSSRFAIKLGNRTIEVEAFPANAWMIEITPDQWVHIVETVTPKKGIGCKNYMIMQKWETPHVVEPEELHENVAEPEHFKIFLKDQEPILGEGLPTRCWIFKAGSKRETLYINGVSCFRNLVSPGSFDYVHNVSGDNWIRIVEVDGQYIMLSGWIDKYKIQLDIEEYFLLGDGGLLIRVDNRVKIATIHKPALYEDDEDQEDEEDNENIKENHLLRYDHGLAIYEKEPAHSINFIESLAGSVDPTEEDLFQDWSPADLGYAMLFLIDKKELTYLLARSPWVLKFNALAPIVSFYSATTRTSVDPHAVDIEGNLYDMFEAHIKVYSPEIYNRFGSTFGMLAAVYGGGPVPPEADQGVDLNFQIIWDADHD